MTILAHGAFELGSVHEYEQEPTEYASLYPVGMAPYGTPRHAAVSIVNFGVVVAAGGGEWIGDVAHARELGFLLLKAAERHEELIKQVDLITEQRNALVTKQDELIRELMK